MPPSLPTRRDTVRLRIRHAVATILLIALTFMIVREHIGAPMGFCHTAVLRRDTAFALI